MSTSISACIGNLPWCVDRQIIVTVPFDSLNSSNKIINKNQASVKLRDQDTLKEQSLRG